MVLLCVVFRPPFFLLFSGVSGSACIILRCFSVGLFIQSEFPCKARCASFFFYCHAFHLVASLLHSAFRVHHGVCCGGQAGASAPMLTMHRGARIPRRPPSFAVSVKKCPAEVGNGNYRLARTGQLTLESINLNYKTGSRTICRRIPDVARTFAHEIGPARNVKIRGTELVICRSVSVGRFSRFICDFCRENGV